MTPPSRAVRHRSRRRLAALAFLSNISLDGTYRDTKISGLSARRTVVDAADAAAVEADDGADAVDGAAAPMPTPHERAASVVRPLLPRDRLKRQKSMDSGDMGRDRAPSEVGIHRERCLTVGAESDSFIRRLVQQGNIGSLMDDVLGHGGSSCESVCGSVRSHKLCSSVSEVSGPGVRFLHATRDRASFGDDRLVLVGRAKLPLLVHSSLNFSRTSRSGRRERHERSDLSSRRRYNSGSRPPLSTIADRVDAFSLLAMEPLQEGQEVSFSRLLQPSPAAPRTRRLHSVENELDAAVAIHQRNVQLTFGRCASHDPGLVHPAAVGGSAALAGDKAVEEELAAESGTIPYDPLLLDNPETQSENHRTVLTFRSYRSSIIDYMKPSDLKRVTNEQFREQFPHIQLTLSKLRSLKRDLRRIAADCRIDMLSVAQAHVYFEKLALRGLIDKPNRKLAAGACLMLAAKMNDVKGDTMSQLVERTETVLRIQRRDLVNCEFSVLVALEFALHLHTSEIEPHMRRLEAGL